MGNVIAIDLPNPVPSLSEMVAFLLFDIRNIIRLDCWDVGGFYGKLVTNLVVVPVFVMSVCYFLYKGQRRTIAFVIKAGGADDTAYESANVKLRQNLLFGAFLLYPGITSTLFRVPQCRSIGSDWFHEDDFRVPCDEEQFITVVIVSIMMIILVPIGVPVLLLFYMNKKKNELGGVQMTALGGSKLCADDLDDDDDRYGFLVRDLKPEFWYYEIVTYARKLSLGGLSIVVGRGTMAQAYFVGVTEAMFLMHHMRAFPYVLRKHNIIDGVGHISLTFTYMVTLILRNEEDGSVFDSEWFPREGYGYFICFLYVVLLPSPSIYYMYKGRNQQPLEPTKEEILQDEIGQLEAAEPQAFLNPLSPDDDEQTPESLPSEATIEVSSGNSSSNDTVERPAGAGPVSTPDLSVADRINLTRIHRISRETARSNVELVQEIEVLRTALNETGAELPEIPPGLATFRVENKSKSDKKGKGEQGHVIEEPQAPPLAPVDRDVEQVELMKTVVDSVSNSRATSLYDIC